MYLITVGTIHARLWASFMKPFAHKLLSAAAAVCCCCCCWRPVFWKTKTSGWWRLWCPCSWASRPRAPATTRVSCPSLSTSLLDWWEKETTPRAACVGSISLCTVAIPSTSHARRCSGYECVRRGSWEDLVGVDVHDMCVYCCMSYKCDIGGEWKHDTVELGNFEGLCSRYFETCSTSFLKNLRVVWSTRFVFAFSKNFRKSGSSRC